MNHETETITATPVPGCRRMSFLPKDFGARAAIAVEAAVCHWMRRLRPQHADLFDKYEQPMEFIAFHPESGGIRRAID